MEPLEGGEGGLLVITSRAHIPRQSTQRRKEGQRGHRWAGIGTTHAILYVHTYMQRLGSFSGL